MENDILNLVYDYSTFGKTGNIDFVECLIRIVAESNGFQSYIRKLLIVSEYSNENSEFNGIAQYDLDSKNISINLIKIYNGINKSIKQYSDLLSNNEILLHMNLYIAQIVLHELEHIGQLKKIDMGYDDLNTHLLELSFRDISSLNYKQNYFCVPCEREAETMSYITIINTLECIKDKVPNLYDYYYATYMQRLISGYDYTNLSPTLEFMEKMNYMNEWKQFNFYSKDSNELLLNLKKEYSLPNRLLCGLPVSADEFNYAYKELKLTRKYRHDIKTTNYY